MIVPTATAVEMRRISRADKDFLGTAPGGGVRTATGPTVAPGARAANAVE